VSDVVHALVANALGELSDEGYQRRVWLAVDGPEVSSPPSASAGSGTTAD